ncbi:MAG: glutamate dehydrogenase, partial [Flavobacterium sp.]
EDNAADIKAVVIAEGANGPTDTEGEAILLANGVEIIPDILCNSGGVIGSYYEWLQNRNGEIWYMDDVIMKLRKKLDEAFGKVLAASEGRSAMFLNSI